MPDIKPFFYYSKDFVKLLYDLNITIVFSTYQAGKLIFVSSPTGQAIFKYAKNFKRPMGISVWENNLAVASRNYIEIYSRSDKLGKAFPPKPGFYDSIFVPQVKYFTGITDMHEVVFHNNEIWAVNTSFSCISRMSDHHHFIPAWQPRFIDNLVPEDRCHLNGLVMDNGKPQFVTMFDQSNHSNGWRDSPVDSGILYDCQNQEIILDKLSMPHSPVRHGDYLFFLQSATGEVMKYNLKSSKLERIIQLNSFLRGMDIYEDYLFIGASKMRESARKFSDLPITENSFAGIEIVNFKTNERVGALTYQDNISEIFEVQIIKNLSKPLMLTENDEGYDRCINCGDDLNYWLVEVDKMDNKTTMENR